MKILVTEPLQPVAYERFEQQAGLELVSPPGLDEAALVAAVADVDGIAVRSAKLTPAVLEAARNLRAVSRHGVGYDNIHVPTLDARGIPLLLAIHANAVSVAEHTMMFLLMLAKRARVYDDATRRGDFSMRSAPVAVDIADKTLTIAGFGRIGSRLAPRALAFDMQVNVYDPYVDPADIRSAGCNPVDTLSDVLPDTDFLSVHCPLNDETRGLVGVAELALLGPHAMVINCARGGIVDEAALQTALAANEIAGAGLDVFTVEPPSPEHPLLQDPRVYLSPHSAGVSVEAARRMSFETADNLLAALNDDVRVGALANPGVAN